MSENEMEEMEEQEQEQVRGEMPHPPPVDRDAEAAGVGNAVDKQPSEDEEYASRLAAAVEANSHYSKPTAMNLDEFVEAFGDVLDRNHVFSNIDESNKQEFLEASFNALDANNSGAVDTSELTAILPRVFDFGTLARFWMAWMSFPFTVIYLIKFVSTGDSQSILRELLVDVWMKKAEWNFCSMMPFKILIWGMLDVFKMDIRNLDKGHTRAKLMGLSLVFLGFYVVAFACLLTYLGSVLPSQLAPVVENGADLFVMLDQGASAVEGFFPIAMFAYLGTQIGLLFVVKRTQDSNRFMLRPMERNLQQLPVMTSERSLFTTPKGVDPSIQMHDIELSPRGTNAWEVVQRLKDQGMVLHKVSTKSGLLAAVGFLGPVLMAFAGSLTRAGTGKPYSGYNPPQTDHEFVVVSSQMCLLVCFWIYFYLLGEAQSLIVQTKTTMSLFSWVAVSKSLDGNAQALTQLVSEHEDEAMVEDVPTLALAPVHMKLNRKENVLGWLRIRSYMMVWRNIEMQMMNVVAGLVGSFVIWLFIALLAIIVHFTAVPRFLLNMQMQVYFLVVFYGTLMYSLYAVFLMWQGIQANALQMEDAKVLSEVMFETKLRQHLLPNTSENRAMEEELDDLFQLQEHISATVGTEEEDLISIFGVPLTPAIFGTLTTAVTVGVSTFLSVLGSG